MSSSTESSSSVDHISHPLIKVTNVFEGHTSSVECVACFPDGRHIASGSWDKTIRFWNVESGQQEGEVLEHDSEVKAIAIAPDGMKIAARMVGWLIVWDVVRRQRIRGVKIDGNSEQSGHPLMVAFSPDGRRIATASSMSTSIRLWDVDTGSLVKELQQHVDTVWHLSFSPGGTRIATGSDVGSFQVLDISTGNTIVGPILGHTDGVTSLVHSPDGRLLITASYDGSVRAWDAETGREMGRPILQSRTSILRIAISPDGKRIAILPHDSTVRLWNLEAQLQVGDPFASRPADWMYFAPVAFSPNGRFVISGVNDDVHLWDTAVVLDSPPSPPTTSNRGPSHSIVPSAQATTHPSPPSLRHQTASQAHRNTSSLSSSILDLPAVVQPKPECPKEVERAPSIDDWDSFKSHRIQQESQAKPESLNAPPAAAEADNQWTRNIRRRWRNLLSRKPRTHVETPQYSPQLPPEEHPTPGKPLDLKPATSLSILPTQVSHTEGEAPSGRLDATEDPDGHSGPKGTLSRPWASFRGTNPRPTESLKMQPSAPHHLPGPVLQSANHATHRSAGPTGRAGGATSAGPS